MATKEIFRQELADTVNKLFEGEGPVDTPNTDPHATEIAEAHFPDRALPGDIIEAIRKQLNQVRDILEEDFDHPAHLVSRTYYSRFRESAPQTEEDARLCIPIGRGKEVKGLRLPDGKDDLIWRATMAQNLGAGAGKVGKQLERIESALDAERLDPDKAEHLLQNLRRAEPIRKQLEKRIEKGAAAELPAGDGESPGGGEAGG